MARNGKFREDLFHRFNEFSITLPPLRDRKEDILLYARHFLRIANAELGKHISDFTQEVQHVLINYAWYGNLRELQNVVKRAALLTDSIHIGIQALPFSDLGSFASEITPLNTQLSGSKVACGQSDEGGTRR